MIEKYEYTAGGETHFTHNKAIAARYDAQHRFFGMNKLQKSLATITGQKRKFKKLWYKAMSENKTTQEEVSEELNRMFR